MLKEFSILFSLLLIFTIQSYPVYKLDKMFFFDPVTLKTCNETDYWTPFNQKTTCYRFVNLEKEDKSDKSKIRVMLDHNIALSTFSDYEQVLKSSTSNWKDVEVTILDNALIDGIMGYKSITLKETAKPKQNIGNYYMNSFYIDNGKEINEKGYWLKKQFDNNNAYTIDRNGHKSIINKKEKRGIRPVIKILKNRLNPISKEVNIGTVIKQLSKVVKYPYENKKYGNKKLLYKQLQGFTFTNDKLVFHASNNNQPEYGILYSYYTNDFNKHYKTEFGKTGHGNGMTFNNKTNKFYVVGPSGYKEIYQYDAKTFKHDGTIKISNSVPTFTAIGYDYKNDYFVGYCGQKIFFVNSKTFKKVYQFDVNFFHTSQDLEYYDGYVFMITSELGICQYQAYSFYKRGSNMIYIYNAKFRNGVPSKNFGRLVGKLYMEGRGELESISFHNKKIYLGFATQHTDKKYAYTFNGMDYKNFISLTKKLAKKEKSYFFNF